MPHLLRLRSIFDQALTDANVLTIQALAVRLISQQKTQNQQSIDEQNTLDWLQKLKDASLANENPLSQNIPSSLLYLYLYAAVKATPKAFISFLTASIMVTTGLTNAGFIILLFTGAATLGAVAFGPALVLGLAFAIPGGFISGLAQKGIYQYSLEGFLAMIMDGTFIKIAKENPGLFFLATACAICSFLVNLGLGLMGMGVFFASGGAPVIILSILFALANAMLVYFTALDQINKKDRNITWEKVIDLVKPTLLNILTLLFGVIATVGLVMTFFPGAAEITQKLENGGKVVFSILLAFAVLTEVFYSWVKSSHLSMIICEAIDKPRVNKENDDEQESVAVPILNAFVNCALGIEGGVEFSDKIYGIDPEEDENYKETQNKHQETYIASQATGAGSSFIWSTTCSAPSPKEVPTQDTITHQFSQFIKKGVSKSEFKETELRQISLTF